MSLLFETVYGRGLIPELKSIAHRPYLVVTMADLWPRFAAEFDDELAGPLLVDHLERADLDRIVADLPGARLGHRSRRRPGPRRREVRRLESSVAAVPGPDRAVGQRRLGPSGRRPRRGRRALRRRGPYRRPCTSTSTSSAAHPRTSTAPVPATSCATTPVTGTGGWPPRPDGSRRAGRTTNASSPRRTSRSSGSSTTPRGSTTATDEGSARSRSRYAGAAPPSTMPAGIRATSRAPSISCSTPSSTRRDGRSSTDRSSASGCCS